MRLYQGEDTNADLYRQQGDVKGPHGAVWVALKVKGHDFSLRHISAKKRTKAFQMNKPKAKTREEVRREAPVRTGDNMQSAPTSNPRRQETANEGEQLNDLTVQQLLCSLESSEDET